jgi:hypothetical protein
MEAPIAVTPKSPFAALLLTTATNPVTRLPGPGATPAGPKTGTVGSGGHRFRRSIGSGAAFGRSARRGRRGLGWRRFGRRRRTPATLRARPERPAAARDRRVSEDRGAAGALATARQEAPCGVTSDGTLATLRWTGWVARAAAVARVPGRRRGRRVAPRARLDTAQLRPCAIPPGTGQWTLTFSGEFNGTDYDHKKPLPMLRWNTGGANSFNKVAGATGPNHGKAVPAS